MPYAFDFTPPLTGDLLTAVMNASWNAGGTYANLYETKIADANTTFLNTTPTITGPTALTVPTIAEPTVDIPSTASQTDIMSAFDTKYLQLVALLSDKMTAFRTTYFPDESAAYTAAEDALQASMANPASYLPANVQAQFYGDDQARVLSEKVRAQDAIIAQFASRRFPLPPDAAASAVLQLEQKAQDELAESSRKLTMLAVEQFKFTIQNTLNLRKTAMDSAIEYIKALASGPEMATKLIGIGYDAQSKLISAASQFYGARIQAAEAVSKVQQFNNTAALTVSEKNQSASIALIEDKLKAMITEANGLAQMSTALFNNLHASVSSSFSRQNGVSYSYSNDTSAAPAAITAV